MEDHSEWEGRVWQGRVVFKSTFLYTNNGRKISPFPLASALKKGDTSLPETSSGCVVMPSFTAWNPFSIITGTHPNHRVYMLPWVFASCKWKRCQKKNRSIPIYRSQTAPAIHRPSGQFCAENIIPMHIIVARSSCFAENKAFSSQFYLPQGEVIFFSKHILQKLCSKRKKTLYFMLLCTLFCIASNPNILYLVSWTATLCTALGLCASS